MKHSDRVGGLLFLALACLIAFDARRLQVHPAGPGTVPVLIAILLGLAAVVLFASSFRREEGSAASAFGGQPLLNPIYVGLVVAAYLVGLAVIGYLPSTVLLVIAMLLKLSTMRPWKIVGTGLAVSLLSFFIFQRLGMHLPVGVFEGWLT